MRDLINHFERLLTNESSGGIYPSLTMLEAKEMPRRPIIDTPEFKRWFAGSKVVDKHGEPMVMFHGTKNTFTNFHPGSHFGSSKAANQRLWHRGAIETDEGSKILPVFLRITNPLHVEDLESADEASLLNMFIRRKAEYPKIDLGVARRDGAYKAAQDAGYDGLVYENHVEDRGHSSWVVFSPNQVKSAIANTTFDPDSEHLSEEASGLSDRPVTTTPAFQQWFTGSKAVDSSGKPLVLYHGTSKDVDFKHFKVPKNGAWFTTSAKDASTYASENDSMSMKMDWDKIVHKNTASRVIPVFLKITNPKHYSELPDDLRHADNYRRAQALHFDKLRSQGYDSVIIGHDTYVMIDLNDSTKIKSAIGNKNFTNKKNMHEARVHHLDGGSPQPVLVFSNPTPVHAETLVNQVRAKRGGVELRGLMLDDTDTLVWDAYDLTHHDVISDLYPEIPTISPRFSTFIIAGDGTIDVIRAFEHDPMENVFVKNVLTVVGKSKGELVETITTDSSAFRNWFGKSKVVDANGNPLVVYHGTKSDVVAFDKHKAGVSDPGLVGKAFYFTPSRNQASSFAMDGHYGKGSAPNVVPVYVALQNPAIIEDGQLPDGRTLIDVHPQGITPFSSAAILSKLKHSGNDGVIFKSDGEIVQVVAFSPKQIKSVIGNNGSFDPSKKNIHEGKVYVVDAGYRNEHPCKVYRNPSPPQAKTLVGSIHAKRGEVYLRGLMYEDKVVLVWDGWDMTHDGILYKFFPDVWEGSSDISTFEIWSDTGFKLSKCGDYDLNRNSFVQNVLTAMKALPAKSLSESAGKINCRCPGSVTKTCTDKSCPRRAKNKEDGKEVLTELGLTIYGEKSFDEQSPARSMLRAVRRVFDEHPKLKEHVDVILTCKGSDSVEVSFVETEKQRKNGHASAFFDIICRAADTFGVDLSLHAKAYPSRRGLKQDELQSFYTRRGFERDENSIASECLMTRKAGSVMSRRRPIDEDAISFYSGLGIVKAWYDSKTDRMFRVTGKFHHTSFVIANPNLFDFEEVMGCPVEKYLQNHPTGVSQYDEELMSNYLNDGWVRLIFKQRDGEISVDAATSKIAAQAVNKLLKDTQYDGPMRIFLEIGGPYEPSVANLSGANARSFLRTGRINRSRVAALAIDEDAPSVAEIEDNPDRNMGRCTTVSCNAILTNFKKPLIKSVAEMPRTGMDALNLLKKRGLKYIPDVFHKPISVQNFVRSHPKGVFLIVTQNHACAVLNGRLYDTERKGLDGRIVIGVAEIVMP